MKFPREINLPIPVYFAGFKSTTLQLQNAGWELSMEQDPRGILSSGRCIRLAIHHPAFQIYGISNHLAFDFHRMQPGPYGDHNPYEYLMSIGFEIRHMANNIQIQRRIRSHDSWGFKSIDARPQLVDSEIVDIEDLCPFRPIGGDLTYVDPQDVDALLAFIKKAQSPKQADIRKKLRKERDKVLAEMGRNPTQEIQLPYENVVQLVKVA